MTSPKPSRGDRWLIDLNPTRGREQAGKRPCLVTSVDLFNQGASGLVVVLPVTSKDKGIPWHVEVNPPEGGLRQRSFIKCEDVRDQYRKIFLTVGYSFSHNINDGRRKTAYSFQFIAKK